MKSFHIACFLWCGAAQASSFSSWVNRSRSEAERRIANGTIRSAAIRLIPGWDDHTQVDIQLLKGGYNFRSHKVSNGTHAFYLRWTEGEHTAKIDVKNRMKVASVGLGPPVLGHDRQAVVGELLPNVKNLDGWAAFERRSQQAQLDLARNIGAAIATYHQIALDEEEMETYHKDTAEQKKRRSNITAATFELIPGAFDAVERADRREPSPGIGTQIVFGHGDWHPRNMVMDERPNGKTKLYLVDSSGSRAMPAAWDFGYFMMVGTVLAGEEGALMPGIESPSQAFNNLRTHPSDPFFGRSNYPSLAVRRAIAAEYLRRWNKSTDVSSCDALVWAMEVEAPAFFTGVESSHCVHGLQHLQDIVLQHPSNATLIEKKISDVQWDCDQLRLRSKIVEAALAGDELLRSSIMEKGLERTSVFVTKSGHLSDTPTREEATPHKVGHVWI